MALLCHLLHLWASVSADLFLRSARADVNRGGWRKPVQRLLQPEPPVCRGQMPNSELREMYHLGRPRMETAWIQFTVSLRFVSESRALVSTAPRFPEYNNASIRSSGVDSYPCTNILAPASSAASSTLVDCHRDKGRQAWQQARQAIPSSLLNTHAVRFFFGILGALGMRFRGARLGREQQPARMLMIPWRGLRHCVSPIELPETYFALLRGVPGRGSFHLLGLRAWHGGSQGTTWGRGLQTHFFHFQRG